jgi:large subunit ribosomal protein L20
MVRVKKGLAAHKRKKNLLQHTKGFRWGRKSKFRLAKEAVLHAWVYSYRDRRTKKRDFRQLWQSKINSACKKNGIAYNQFIYKLKNKKIGLDRKILSDLAQNNIEIFEKILAEVK